MLPLIIENMIYSYIRQVNCVKFKKINKEIRHALTLCHECDEYKLIMSRCRRCADDYCISCTYKNHYYVNGKIFFNNNIIHCLYCSEEIICEDYYEHCRNTSSDSESNYGENGHYGENGEYYGRHGEYLSS